MGSGFGGVARAVDAVATLAYREIPGFPVGSVPGHEGRLLLGSIAGLEVAVLCGRAHFYEGFSLAEVTFPVRVLACLGVDTLLLTNAAGGIGRGLVPGSFMILSDHINLMGANPLRPTGRAAERSPAVRGGSNFVDLSEVYDPGLRRQLMRAARAESVRARAGVYLAVSGPSYETPAEIRAFHRWGADAVGMSTVPEAIVARQCGLRVAAVSCITNRAAGLGGRGARLDHRDVLEQARAREAMATAWVTRFIAGLR